MENVQLADIQQWTGAELVGILHERRRIPRVSTDSRTVEAGDLFVALKGPTFDGHDFVKQALARGASAAVVEQGWLSEQPQTTPEPLLTVSSGIEALGSIAREYRRRFELPVIGVTGSSGKTTTKELIATVLSTTYKVLKSVGTENNEIGVPLTLLELNREHEAVVLELAARKQGDIKHLCEIAKPTIGVLLNIGAAHIELFGTVEGVAKAKGEFLDYLDESCLALVNADDCVVVKEVKRTKGRLLAFSLVRESQFRGEGLVLDQEGRGHFSLQHHAFDLRIPGRHNVYNALAAAGIGRVMDVPWSDIQTALAHFSPVEKRGEVIESRGVRVIDDTYNANPASMLAALEMLAHIEVNGGRRIAVLGDMLELGEQSADFHEGLGRQVAEREFDILLTIGPMAEMVAQAAVQAGLPEAQSRHFVDEQELADHLKGIVRARDIVLLKASRGMHLEKVVTQII